ncbi:HB2J protein, partial [Malurus elegans]|nr:HB2J protein [Malurus elegans]
AMGRMAAAGAVLGTLVGLGTPPAAGAQLSIIIKGTENVKLLDRFIYHREEYMRFDSDVGHFVGVTPYGERQARYWNSERDVRDRERAEVDILCRHNYEVFTPFLVGRR